jgi:hypothetical protein
LANAEHSHLIFGAGSTSYVISSQFSKLCCIDALYMPPENLDAIALLANGLVFAESIGF